MYRTHECSVHVAHVVQCMGTAQDQIEHIYGEAQVQLGVAATRDWKCLTRSLSGPHVPLLQALKPGIFCHWSNTSSAPT